MAPRAVWINYRTRDRMFAERDCRLVEPLGSVGFVASYAGFGKRWGGLTRTGGIRFLSDGLLPDAVIRRGQKAFFNGSRFGPVSREFARTWDGQGLNDDLVDAERLRGAWLSDLPPGGTGPLLQQAWLASSAGRP
jgi:asparagine synthase (glutamine-hydrolysing)